MVQPIITNQHYPLIPSQEFLSGPQLSHFLSCEISSYHIIVRFLQVFGFLIGSQLDL